MEMMKKGVFKTKTLKTMRKRQQMRRRKRNRM